MPIVTTTATTVDEVAADGSAGFEVTEPGRRHATVATELGELTLVGDGSALVGVYFPEHRPEPDQRGIIEFTHRRTWTRSRMKSRCSPSEASVRAIDTWGSVSMPLKARMASMVSGITIAWLKTW